jgi:hypothetical protein
LCYFVIQNDIEIENRTINWMLSPDRNGKPTAKKRAIFLGQKERPKEAPFWVRKMLVLARTCNGELENASKKNEK